MLLFLDLFKQILVNKLLACCRKSELLMNRAEFYNFQTDFLINRYHNLNPNYLLVVVLH